jgi:PAS domain S-box-containing protein
MQEGRLLLLRALAVASAYYLAGQSDRVMGWTTSPSALWPPNAVLLAVLLLAPPRLWWLYSLAVLPADLGISFGAVPLKAGLGLYASNTAQSLVAAMLVRSAWRERPRFDNAQFVLIFVIAALAGVCVASFMGAATVIQFWPSRFWETWRTWYVANVLTLLTFVPALCIGMTSIHRDTMALRRKHEGHLWEGALLLVGVAFVAAMVYEGQYVGSEPLAVLMYAPLPFLLWIALRFGPGLMSAALMVLVLIAIHGAAHSRGPFLANLAGEKVLHMQLVLITMSLPLMFLAAVVRERQEAARALRLSEREARRNEERYREVVEAQTEMVCRFLPDTTLTFVNEAYCRYFGRMREELIGTKFLSLIPEEARGPALRHVQSLIERPRVEADEHEVVAADSSIGWQQWVNHVIFDGDGNVLELQGIGRDITERKRQEHKLHEQETALRASYNQIQDLAGRLIVAQEAERTRIARELHDGVNQQLAALSISLSGLKRKLPPTLETLQSDVAELQQSAKELSDGVRDLSHQLHPGVLQHAGLVAALRARCDEFQQQSNITTTFTCDNDIGPLDRDLSLCLYRVAQEALHNVARHASATRVDVSMQHANGHLRVIVEDDGCGFDVPAARLAPGLGLTSIEERVRLVRGVVCVDSHPNQGTKLTVQVPIGDGSS